MSSSARLLPLLLLASAPALAGSPVSEDEYSRLYTLTSPDAGERELLQRCLESWGDHPFDPDKLRIRRLAAQVRVVGIGTETRDTTQTSYPQLVLVKPAVSVMSGTTLDLLNPNGWYCIDANVSVAARTTFRLACDGHLAEARSGVAVMGNADTQGSVTVAGTSEVIRVGCD